MPTLRWLVGQLECPKEVLMLMCLMPLHSTVVTLELDEALQRDSTCISENSENIFKHHRMEMWAGMRYVMRPYGKQRWNFTMLGGRPHVQVVLNVKLSMKSGLSIRLPFRCPPQAKVVSERIWKKRMSWNQQIIR